MWHKHIPGQTWSYFHLRVRNSLPKRTLKMIYQMHRDCCDQKAENKHCGNVNCACKLTRFQLKCANLLVCIPITQRWRTLIESRETNWWSQRIPENNVLYQSYELTVPRKQSKGRTISHPFTHLIFTECMVCARHCVWCRAGSDEQDTDDPWPLRVHESVNTLNKRSEKQLTQKLRATT